MNIIIRQILHSSLLYFIYTEIITIPLNSSLSNEISMYGNYSIKPGTIFQYLPGIYTSKQELWDIHGTSENHFIVNGCEGSKFENIFDFGNLSYFDFIGPFEIYNINSSHQNGGSGFQIIGREHITINGFHIHNIYGLGIMFSGSYFNIINNIIHD